MKRDVDLIRHLLLDIERRGAESACDELRNGAVHESDERTRYHVRLLVDAGLAKEVDRTTAATACVRLTNAGHEFLDLCRGEARWREAKWIVQEQTGGLSLAVLRAVLTKWAVEGVSRGDRQRRVRRAYRPHYRGEPVYRVESYRYEREPLFDEEPPRVMRSRPEYRERLEPVERWDDPPYDMESALSDGSLGVSLPVHMI